MISLLFNAFCAAAGGRVFLAGNLWWAQGDRRCEINRDGCLQVDGRGGKKTQSNFLQRSMKQPRFTDELAKKTKQTNKKSPDKAVLGMEFPVFAVVT